MKLNLQRKIWRLEKMKQKGIKIGLGATLMLWAMNVAAEKTCWVMLGSMICIEW